MKKYLCSIGVPADRWRWHSAKKFMTMNSIRDIRDNGAYLDPPWEINGHVVRGGPGWVVVSANDLARLRLISCCGTVIER